MASVERGSISLTAAPTSRFSSRDNHGAISKYPSIITAQQPILFINEARHEETKRVDIRANLTICFPASI
jgi:hypothetical protein